MKSNDIALSGDAIKVIEALRHNCGTYGYYTATLARLFNLVFSLGDEIGMDGMEMVHTLRALRDLNSDLACLAGRECAPFGLMTGAGEDQAEGEESEDTAGKVEAAFSGIMDPEGINLHTGIEDEDIKS